MTLPPMDVATLCHVGARCRDFLASHTDADWSARPPEMDWTAAEVVAHLANTLAWYSFDFAAGVPQLPTVDITVDSGAAPDDLVRTVHTGTVLLAAALAASEPGALGHHPRGNADVSGFVGMACDELLVHTDDVARALGVPHSPAPEHAEAVLRRIFPWAPLDLGEPHQTLLWANGRTALDDLPRLGTWSWHCAPLSEWDGRLPADMTRR